MLYQIKVKVFICRKPFIGANNDNSKVLYILNSYTYSIKKYNNLSVG